MRCGRPGRVALARGSILGIIRDGTGPPANGGARGESYARRPAGRQGRNRPCRKHLSRSASGAGAAQTPAAAIGRFRGNLPYTYPPERVDTAVDWTAGPLGASVDGAGKAVRSLSAAETPDALGMPKKLRAPAALVKRKHRAKIPAGQRLHWKGRQHDHPRESRPTGPAGSRGGDPGCME